MDIKFELFRLNQAEYEYVKAMHPQWTEDEVRQQADANMAAQWSTAVSEFRLAMYAVAQEIGGLNLLAEVRKNDDSGSSVPAASALKILTDYGGTAALILTFEKMQTIWRMTLPQESQIVPRRWLGRLADRCRPFMFRGSRKG